MELWQLGHKGAGVGYVKGVVHSYVPVVEMLIFAPIRVIGRYIGRRA